MNKLSNPTTPLNKRLQLTSVNGCIRLGWVEDTPPESFPTEPIQLELDFDQGDTQWH